MLEKRIPSATVHLEGAEGTAAVGNGEVGVGEAPLANARLLCLIEGGVDARPFLIRKMSARSPQVCVLLLPRLCRGSLWQL